MRRSPEAYLLFAPEVWLLPSTLNELNVNVVGTSTRAAVAVRAGWAPTAVPEVDVVRAAARAVATTASRRRFGRFTLVISAVTGVILNDVWGQW